MLYQKYSLLDSALQLAKEGFPVFPLRPREKTPLVKGWHQAATTDEETIRKWWNQSPDANIGIPTGEKSGIVVLDIDGEAGKTSLDALESQYGQLPETYTVKTGKGQHSYFKHPGYPLKNSVGKLGTGIDIRGDGGYVAASGSIHESGNRYEVLTDFSLAEFPNWLAKLHEQAASKRDSGRPKPVIPVGERNDTLFHEACSWRGKGHSENAIRGFLYGRNQDCEEPLPDAQIDTILNRAMIYEPNAALAGMKLTDVGNAERLKHLHGNDIRYSHEKKEWFFWDGKRWREDRIGRAHRLAQETMRETLDGAGTNTQVQTWAETSEKSNGIQRMLKEAQVLPGIPVRMEDLDQNPWLFNVKNGTLDLKADVFFEHSRSNLITKLAPVEYDPDATAPRWERFISEVFGNDAELIHYVQTSLGYLLTGDTSQQVMWIAYGHGSNGKSTLLRTILKLIGDYGKVTSFSTFEADNKNATGNDLAALVGSRFVMATESENERRLAEARVKSITGGDSISCRFLYGEFFEYPPQFKVWLAVNHKPLIRNTDHGIWRRIHLVPFNQTFEVGKEKDLDATLEREFPGILNWLLAGLKDWRENGLTVPESVKAATQEYKDESDPLKEWLEERTEPEPKPGVFETPTELHRDYREWMKARGEEKFQLSMKNFSIQLSERGFEKKRTEKGYRFLGMALRQPEPVGAKGV